MRTKEHQNITGVYMGGGRLKSGEYKAHYEFDGISVMLRVLHALDETPEVSRVVAIVPKSNTLETTQYTPTKPLSVYEAGCNFLTSVQTAASALLAGESALVVFSDLALARSSSLSRLSMSAMPENIVIPCVFGQDVSAISKLHNLHFMPSKEGYFHLGSAAIVGHKAVTKIDIVRLQYYYNGKSFRTNPKEKLRVAYKLGGVAGLATAVRIWLSANLQHKGLQNLDLLVPSPSIEHYRRIASSICGVPCILVFGSYADLFLDFDYEDDAELIQNNWKVLNTFLESNV